MRIKTQKLPPFPFSTIYFFLTSSTFIIFFPTFKQVEIIGAVSFSTRLHEDLRKTEERSAAPAPLLTQQEKEPSCSCRGEGLKLERSDEKTQNYQCSRKENGS